MKHRIIVIAALALASLAGCSGSLSPDGFVPPRDNIHHTKQTLGIHGAAGGADDSHDLFTGEVGITNMELITTINAFIEQSAAFQQASPGASPRYLLAAFITELDPDAACITCSARITIAYTLKDLESDMVIWSKRILTEHSVGLGTNFMGTYRIRMAMQGAMYENVRTMVQELSELKL